MPACCDCRFSIWPILCISVMSIILIVIMASTNQSTGTDIIIYLGCLVAFFICIIINVYSGRDRLSDEEMITEQRSTRTTPIAPRVMTHFGVAMPAERGQYRHGTFYVLPNFGGRNNNAQIARMAIRALPPIKSFNEDKTSADGSQCECSICMENFKDGELIQPFGLCAHEFHSSCLNSWLHSGNTTCPVCRHDLSTSIHAS